MYWLMCVRVGVQTVATAARRKGGPIPCRLRKVARIWLVKVGSIRYTQNGTAAAPPSGQHGMSIRWTSNRRSRKPARKGKAKKQATIGHPLGSPRTRLLSRSTRSSLLRVHRAAADPLRPQPDDMQLRMQLGHRQDVWQRDTKRAPAIRDCNCADGVHVTYLCSDSSLGTGNTGGPKHRANRLTKCKAPAPAVQDRCTSRRWQPQQHAQQPGTRSKQTK